MKLKFKTSLKIAWNEKGGWNFIQLIQKFCIGSSFDFTVGALLAVLLIKMDTQQAIPIAAEVLKHLLLTL